MATKSATMKSANAFIIALFSIFSICSYAKLDKVSPDKNGIPMEINDIYALHEFTTGETIPNPFTATQSNEETPSDGLGAIDPSKVPSLKLKNLFSPTCTIKVCDMFYWAVSNKAINLGMNKICASYFMGANFGCPQFPSPDDFFNAPSVCAEQMAGLAAKLVPLANGNVAPLLGNLLGPDFASSTCGRRSWQNYQIASNDFYYNCYTELANTTIANTYKVAKGIQNFQQFRNQACAINEDGKNCFAVFSAQAAQPQVINIFQEDCNYATGAFGVPVQAPAWATTNSQLMQAICAQFSGYKCCAANDITMYQQAQRNKTNLSIFPPCLQSYLQNACPTVDLQNYCQNGSIASVTTSVGQVTFGRMTGGQFPFPNMYNKMDAIQFQGVISGAFAQLMGGGVEPWIFYAQYPFQVQVVDFVYYDVNGTAITPVNPTTGVPTGIPYFPPGGDYAAAESIKISYQLVVQNVESQEQASTYLNAKMLDPNLGFVVSLMYGGGGMTAVPQAIVTEAIYKEEQPLELPPKNSAVSSASVSVLFVGMLSVAAMLAVLVV